MRNTQVSRYFPSRRMGFFTISMSLIFGLILLGSVYGVQESFARPYTDIMNFAYNSNYVIVIGTVTDGKKAPETDYTNAIYEITVEQYLSNSLDKETIHTFSQPQPTGGRGGNNYSYFDIGDRVILVLWTPNEYKITQQFPNTYHISDLINPHSIEHQLKVINSPYKQKEFLKKMYPEEWLGGYYKTRHPEIVCGLGEKPIFKKNASYASCVSSNTYEKLLQRGWLETNPTAAKDLEKNIHVKLSTDKTEYTIGDDVTITMSNYSLVPVNIGGGFSALTLSNIDLDESIKMWYFSYGTVKNNNKNHPLLMPRDEVSIVRNLWDDSKIINGVYEIEVSYTIMDSGKSINLKSHTQFKVI